jgi:hypothetical protein
VEPALAPGKGILKMSTKAHSTGTEINLNWRKKYRVCFSVKVILVLNYHQLMPLQKSIKRQKSNFVCLLLTNVSAFIIVPLIPHVVT